MITNSIFRFPVQSTRLAQLLLLRLQCTWANSEFWGTFVKMSCCTNPSIGSGVKPTNVDFTIMYYPSISGFLFIFGMLVNTNYKFYTELPPPTLLVDTWTDVSYYYRFVKCTPPLSPPIPCSTTHTLRSNHRSYHMMDKHKFRQTFLSGNILFQKHLYSIESSHVIMPPTSKLEGHIASGTFVRACIRLFVRPLCFLMHSITSEPCMLGFWNFIYGFFMKK